MNAPPNDSAWVRLGLATGLAMAVAAGIWWLAATPLSGGQPGIAAPIADRALAGLWLVRAVWLAPFTLRTAALIGARGGSVAALALQMPAWPVLATAMQAGGWPLSRLLIGEILLALGALALACGGAGLRRTLRSSKLRSTLATLLGLATSAAIWAWGLPWLELRP